MLVTQTQSQKCCEPGYVPDWLNNPDRCVACEAGKVSKFDTDAGKATGCVWCDPCKKQYSAAGSTYCKTCGQVAGEYWEREPDSMKGKCRKCNTGSVRPAQEIDLSVDIEGIDGNIGGECRRVDKDGNEVEDLLSAGDKCETCPANEGLYSNEFGKAVCKRCPNGKYVDVLLFNAKTTPPAKCALREKDWAALTPAYKTDISTRLCGDDQACKACPIGYAGEEGICQACAEGRMQADSGQTSCSACVGGRYTNQLQQTSCKPCETGKATNEEGKISCQSCKFGKAQGSTGQTSCTACARGQYTAENQQKTCQDCAKGKAVARVGQQECDSCKAGSAQPLAGQISCVSFNR
jgi:hypothetical protein